MGLRDKYKDKAENRGFKALELNEGNVVAIFNRCLTKSDGSPVLTSMLFPPSSGYLPSDKLHFLKFQKDEMLKDKKTLEYMFGQLQVVHSQKSTLSMDDFFKNYAGSEWTHDKSSLMELLFLANCEEVDLIAPFNAFRNDTTNFAKPIKPTLSPKDVNFDKWWEEHKSEWED